VGTLYVEIAVSVVRLRFGRFQGWADCWLMRGWSIRWPVAVVTVRQHSFTFPLLNSTNFPTPNHLTQLISSTSTSRTQSVRCIGNLEKSFSKDAVTRVLIPGTLSSYEFQKAILAVRRRRPCHNVGTCEGPRLTQTPSRSHPKYRIGSRTGGHIKDPENNELLTLRESAAVYFSAILPLLPGILADRSQLWKTCSCGPYRQTDKAVSTEHFFRRRRTRIMFFAFVESRSMKHRVPTATKSADSRRIVAISVLRSRYRISISTPTTPFYSPRLLLSFTSYSIQGYDGTHEDVSPKFPNLCRMGDLARGDATSPP
jgi:hypothetical protein